MTEAIKLTESIQDGVLTAVETTQRWSVEAVKAMTSTFDRFAPPMPPLPFLDSLASPQDAAKLSFDFADRLLAANRVFVTDLVSAVAAAAPATDAKTPRKAPAA
jgi:hypothetical protein